MTLYAIHKLTDEEFDAALAEGVIKPEAERHHASCKRTLEIAA